MNVVWKTSSAGEHACSRCYYALDLADICPRHGSSSLRFNQREVSRIGVDAVFTWHPKTIPTQQSSSVDPVIAYLEMDTIHWRRRSYVFGPRKGARSSSPVIRIHTKQLQRMQPFRNYEDPYIAAVLLALAQEQRLLARDQHDTATLEGGGGLGNTDYDASAYKVRTQYRTYRHGNHKLTFQVHALLTRGVGPSEVFIYTAQIPRWLLDMFDNPRESYLASGVRISYYRVPLSDPEGVLSVLRNTLSR